MLQMKYANYHLLCLKYYPIITIILSLILYILFRVGSSSISYPYFRLSMYTSSSEFMSAAMSGRRGSYKPARIVNTQACFKYAIISSYWIHSTKNGKLSFTYTWPISCNKLVLGILRFPSSSYSTYLIVLLYSSEYLIETLNFLNLSRVRDTHCLPDSL